MHAESGAGVVEIDRPLDELPIALADLHRSTVEDEGLTIHLPWEGTGGATWAADPADLVIGAGFQVVRISPGQPCGGTTIEVRRRRSLPDTVAPGMHLLVCGLNPSPSAADAGVGFFRAGNRFWPAALAAGLVTIDRDPRHALEVHAVGMTDLVKRTTERADELSTAEFRAGVDRVERLCRRLAPAAVCMVGLAGWRAAVDRRAVAGVQERTLGGQPVYVMPSTSGLNAATSLDALTDHLRAAADLADRAHL